MNQEPSAAFLSDNAAPAHPAALDALFEVNTGTMPSYGEDPVTARAADGTDSAAVLPWLHGQLMAPSCRATTWRSWPGPRATWTRRCTGRPAAS